MSLYEGLKDLVTLAQKADNAELMAALLEVQSSALEQQEEIRRLRDRVRELEEQTSFQGTLVFDGDVYWSVTEAGERDGPFCSPCWDKGATAVRLHTRSDGAFKCPTCETVVTDPDDPGGGGLRVTRLVRG